MRQEGHAKEVEVSTPTRSSLRTGLAILALGVPVALGACGSSDQSSSTSTAATNPVALDTPYSASIDPANFVSKIDNPYLPFTPGTRFRFEGVMKNGTTPQTDTELVLRRHKRILGVDCTVVRDTVTSRGRPVERTYDWYAQDKQGNVWNKGEETQELKHGRFGKMIDSGPAGRNGAKPGIAMEGTPTAGDAYWQFHWPGHALDKATVMGSGGPLHVPYRNFSHTLVTQERSPLEPGVLDQKWSVAGLGYVREKAVAGDKEQIRLVSVTH
jgi:hypothetical protein